MRAAFIREVTPETSAILGFWERFLEFIKENPNASCREASDVLSFEGIIPAEKQDETEAEREVYHRISHKITDTLASRYIDFALSDQCSPELAAMFLMTLWQEHYFDTFSTNDRLLLSRKLSETAPLLNDSGGCADVYFAALELGGTSYSPEEYKDLFSIALKAVKEIGHEQYRDSIGSWIVAQARDVLGKANDLAIIMRAHDVYNRKWHEGLNSLVGFVNPREREPLGTFTPHPGLNRFGP